MQFENGYDVMNEGFLLDKDEEVEVENDYLFKVNAGTFKSGTIKTIGKYINKKKKKI